MSHRVGLEIRVPNSPNVAAAMDIDINIFCDGWETGNGNIEATGRGGRPYITDLSPGNPLRSFFFDFVMPTVEGSLVPGVQGFAIPPEQVAGGCTHMDYLAVTPATLLEGKLRFIRKASTSLATVPNATVRLVQIKRLRILSPTPVYYPTESPVLDFYAGFTPRQHQLPPLAEGQTTSLASVPAVSFPLTGQSLILIATLSHNLGNPTDSMYAVYSASTNYGSGRRTIIVNKVYRDPYNTTTTPRYVTAPAYEITVDITLPSTPISR
ncbi:hypothetical protein F183_A25660 [Bryobacterales bacterium F-183]|nr:hypothetical protein F183_A25660 [Bryobacterales bacterium F-183]